MKTDESSAQGTHAPNYGQAPYLLMVYIREHYILMNPFLKWALLLPLSIIKTIAGRFTAPFVVLFADADGWLPSWLSWFQTPDNSLDGDNGWKNEHMQWRFKFPLDIAMYLGRVGWLVRNNMYGFDIQVLGAKCLETDQLATVGDLATSDSPAHSGSVARKLYRDGKVIYWQWYYIYVYGSRCIRLNFGWKLWGFDGTAKNIQYVFYPNPLKSAKP